MCNPFANFLTNVAGTGAQLYENNRNARRTAKQLRNEGQRLQQQSADELRQSYADEAIFRQQSNARTAAARTRLSRTGITTSGSAEDVLADRQGEDELQVLRGRYGALRSANDLYRAGRDRRRQARRTLSDSYFSTGQTLLSQAPGIISAFPE